MRERSGGEATCKLSRSHCTRRPAYATLPSWQYVAGAPADSWYPTVVSNPLGTKPTRGSGNERKGQLAMKIERNGA